ncbi:MarR family transcriptional regulator, partial [uncultured Muribaculum sp.]
TEKETENPSSKFSLSEPQRKVFHLLCMNSDITYAELMRQTNLSRSYLSRIISALKEHGYVVRKGSDRAGNWEIRKSLTD